MLNNNINKIIYAITFIIVALRINITAQTPDELMLKANKYYQNNQFEQAIDSYKEILFRGYESGPLYYNLGNSYFKTNKLGYAIYCYEKGLKLTPNDDDLLYNLKISNSRTVDKITELPKLFIISWWDGIVTSLSISSWSVLTLIIFWIFLLSIAGYIFIRKIQIQRAAFFAGSFSLASLIIVAMFLFARIGRESSSNFGILQTQIYTAKVTPDGKSNDAFIIHEGIKFVIEDNVNDWAKIRLVDGKVGWIQKDVFGQI
jgi:tetratricopeptide (TPR) repeat protein